MKKLVFAAIDIGSYNCRLTIFETQNDSFKILHTFANGTNLIKNLSFNNEFNEKNTKKTLDCLIKFSKKLTEYKVENYRCIATEACRQVINPNYFINLAREKTGLKIEIISSYEEAKLSFKSCSDYVEQIGKKGILFDIGGGSTEFSFFNDKINLFNTKSISYGVINLSEKKELFGKDIVYNELKSHFFNIWNEIKNKVDLDVISIGSCNTITTLCAIHLNLKFFDSKRIENTEMNNEQLQEVINYIKAEPIEKLKKIPCVGSKYKLLLNGIIILESMLDTIPIKKVIVTLKGLRDGIMKEFVSLK